MQKVYKNQGVKRALYSTEKKKKNTQYTKEYLRGSMSNIGGG